MRPIKSMSSSTSTNEIKIWKSPIPYLFGGLAIMLILISVALVILVCSYKKRSSSQSSNSDEEMNKVMSKNIIEINSEPEVLVIMAGEEKPTYIAKPIISSLPYCTCGAESSSSTSSSSLTNEQININ
ncbi:protein GLUTAMINE DUMPER 6-like [Trifolium pratense]|uniref:protein GLUTAMINE DUMPER 6-like n=1 Tax=Trifolium pratense TaxID=57577 RepID=UPI001E69562C|nr:protein GLUTAMINE DUMPER 6-like [Trifolium pratense]